MDHNSFYNMIFARKYELTTGEILSTSLCVFYGMYKHEIHHYFVLTYLAFGNKSIILTPAFDGHWIRQWTPSALIPITAKGGLIYNTLLNKLYNSLVARYRFI